MADVLGVDSSTQATKVEVRDVDDGTLLASGRAPHPSVAPTKSEQEPAAWWEALCDAVLEAGLGGCEAVSVAAQQHGLVALDAEGFVIRPAKLWNDTESAPQAQRLVSRLGAEGWAEATGLVPLPSYTITKLAWLSENEQDSLARLAKALLPHDWLTWRLCRRFVTDRGDASGTGYFSAAANRWRPDLLELVDDQLDWQAVLPDVLGPRDVAGEGTGSLSAASGALVAPGTGDNMGAALALGLGPGEVAISLGTSGTVYCVSEEPTADATGAVAGFADATGRFLPLVCTLNCTKVTDWCAGMLGRRPGELDALAATAPAGSGGLTMVPYLDGERTPDLPGASASLHGLTSRTGAGEIARAAYEGVVCGLLEGMDALGRVGIPTGGRVFVIGGGARSPVFRRVLADLLQRPVLVPDADELVAAGACVQAAAVLRGADPVEVAREWDLARGTTVEPRLDEDLASEIRVRYADVRERMETVWRTGD